MCLSLEDFLLLVNFGPFLNYEFPMEMRKKDYEGVEIDCCLGPPSLNVRKRQKKPSLLTGDVTKSSFTKSPLFLFFFS